jgi:mRNA-degrading endonuclease RelE of RelBE toxin-antitoxin system
VPAEVRAIPQPIALEILKALHQIHDRAGNRWDTGQGKVKAVSGEFKGLLRLRVGNDRVLFDETDDTITVHRVRVQKDTYQ